MTLPIVGHFDGSKKLLAVPLVGLTIRPKQVLQPTTNTFSLDVRLMAVIKKRGDLYAETD